MRKFNATIRRLSDEEVDPMENDDPSMEPLAMIHWAPWGPDTIQDVYNIISRKLTTQQQEIIEAHLLGRNYRDLGVTEKYWRYHWAQAVKRIRRELKI